MIAEVADRIRSDRRMAAAAAGAAVLLVLMAMAGIVRIVRPRASTTMEAAQNGEVEHVRSGSKIVLDDGVDVLYAGIRAPYDGEPLFEESLRRNTGLVEGKKVRLRYDDSPKDAKDRLHAYVWIEGSFVNETMVREGLAYVQLTTGNRRFDKELLAAQAEARKNHLGLWRLPAPSKELHYAADPKYGNFHRPDCEEVPKIKAERLVTVPIRTKAFDLGFAPCPKCKP